MRSVKIALAVGLGVTVLSLAAVLTESPPTVLASNSVTQEEPLINGGQDATACQQNERIPAGTRAIRISLGAFNGPRVAIKVSSAAGAVTSGAHGSDWDGRTLTVAVKHVAKTVSPAKLCFTIDDGEGAIALGTRSGHATAARATTGQYLPGRVRVEYLGAGHSSWLSRAGSVARHMGLGRAWSGRWVALWVLLSMLVIAALTSRLIVRELHE
jgi:hypothetical protein